MRKKIKILCLVNVLTEIKSVIYQNHVAMLRWTAKNMPWVELYHYTPHRTSIDNARNTAALEALKAECDYLMFLDDDVMVPVDAIKRLIDAKKDVVAGLVIIRGWPFNVMAFKYNKSTKGGNRHMDFYNKLPKEKDGSLVKLVECDAIGFSLALIKCSVLQRMATPYFVTSAFSTEDVYFCVEAKEQLGKVSIFMDTSIECGHLMNPEAIQWKLRDAYIALYKRAYIQKVEKPNRLSGYHNKNVANVRRAK